MNVLRGENRFGFRGQLTLDFPYLKSFGGATRGELNQLLQSKLSDVLTDEQKIRKISNLLSALKKEGIIKLTNGKKWILVKV